MVLNQKQMVKMYQQQGKLVSFQGIKQTKDVHVEAQRENGNATGRMSYFTTQEITSWIDNYV